MPLTLKTTELQYKDSHNVYHGINAVAEKPTADVIADLDAAIEERQDTVDGILDEQETRGAQITSAAQSAVDGIEGQKNTMIASIASVAGMGTDTTLTQFGVAADAKVTGDKISEIKSAFNATDNRQYGTVISPTPQENGYYTSNSGKIKFTSNGGSRAFIADLSSYVGYSVNVLYKPKGGSSRLTAICDSEGNIGSSKGEAGMTASGFVFDITATYNQLYISYTYEEDKNLSVRISNGEITKLVNDTANITALQADTSNQLAKIEALRAGEYDLKAGAVWEIGSINTTTGADDDGTGSNKSIRTKGFIYTKNVKRITLTVNTGYKCMLLFYSDQSTLASVTGGRVYKTGTYTFYLTNVPLCRIRIANTSDTEANVSYANQVSVTYETVLAEIITNSDTVINNHGKYLPDFVPGTFSTSTGAEITSTTRIRTGYLFAAKNTVISMPDVDAEKRLIAYYYNKDTKAFIANTGDWGTLCIVPYDCYVRVLLRKANNSAVSSDDITSLKNELRINFAVPTDEFEKVRNSVIRYIPAYYNTQLTAAIQNATQDIMDCGHSGSHFICVADQHYEWNVNYWQNISNEIMDKMNISNLVLMGDLFSGSDDKDVAIKYIMDSVNPVKDSGKVFTLVGNHDTNNYGTNDQTEWLSESELYALMMKQCDDYVTYGGTCYYYYDNPSTKTRWIFLNTHVSGNADSDQMTWFENTLNGMPDGYHALVFMHLVYTINTGEPMSPFAEDVCDICDTFNANESRNTDNKKIEAIFGGHSHKDRNEETTGGIPIVLFDTASTLSHPEAETGTVSETAMDIVTINYTDKAIKCRRIGRGSDRTITYA